MKAAVISDIHDHITNLLEVLTHPAALECNVLLCCGDICSPFIVDVINEHWSHPVHFVFGNNDGDRFMISEKAGQANKSRNDDHKLHLHGEYLFKDRGTSLSGLPDDTSLGMTHYPEIARHLTSSGDRRMICYGHSHIPGISEVDQTILVNPGSVMGYIPSERKNVPHSFAVTNLVTLSAELIHIR